MAARIVLRTARQTLRTFVPDDAEALAALNRDPEVNRYEPIAPFESVDAARRFLEEYEAVYRDEGMGRWVAVDSATGEFLGWCGLRCVEDGEVDVGYRYRRAVWGQGLATEAARACLRYGFEVLGLPRVIGRAHEENAASIRVLEKIGLRFERAFTYEGMPSVMYGIDREGWETEGRS